MNARVEYERLLCYKDILTAYKMQLQSEISDRTARIARLDFELRCLEPFILHFKNLLGKGEE